MKYPAPLPLPKHLSDEQWKCLQNAILVDCDTIIEAYKDVDESPEFHTVGSDAVHKSNALYVKRELATIGDDDMSRYVPPAKIWEWMKIFIRDDFFLSNENKSKFYFPNAKREWLSISSTS